MQNEGVMIQVATGPMGSLGFMLKLIFGVGLFWTAMSAAQAAPTRSASTTEALLIEKFTPMLGPLPKDALKPIEGTDLYRLKTGSGEYEYVTGDGKYLIHGGTLFGVDDRSLENLTARDKAEATRPQVQALLFDKSAQAHLIPYPPKGKKVGVLYVFTDPSCPYCKRFHKEVLPELVKQGVEVHYVSFPVVNPKVSIPKTEDAFCRPTPQERREVFDKLEDGGREAPNPSCKGFSDPYIQLGMALGAQGTPFLVFRDLSVMNGLAKVKDIVQRAKRADLANSSSGQ